MQESYQHWYATLMPRKVQWFRALITFHIFSIVSIARCVPRKFSMFSFGLDKIQTLPIQEACQESFKKSFPIFQCVFSRFTNGTNKTFSCAQNINGFAMLSLSQKETIAKPFGRLILFCVGTVNRKRVARHGVCPTRVLSRVA